jgi:hypothetical protein
LSKIKEKLYKNFTKMGFQVVDNLNSIPGKSYLLPSAIPRAINILKELLKYHVNIMSRNVLIYVV